MMHTVLIPAAGESRRFKERGFVELKPFLKVSYLGKDKFMYEHAASAFHATSKPCRVFLGVQEDVALSDLVTGIVVGKTPGQADTIQKMTSAVLSGLKEDEDTYVYVSNVDTIFEPSMIELLHTASKAEDWSVVSGVFKSNSSDYSYVRFNPNGPADYAEKVPISTSAMAGLWFFRSLRDLDAALKKCMAEQTAAERYLSFAMSDIPGTHGEIDVGGMFMDWGTPDKLLRFARVLK